MPGAEEPHKPRNPNAGKTAPYVVETLFESDESSVAAVDIIECGADPKGEKDSTEAFRDAIRKAASLGGGTVWVPAGDYLISDTLTIPPLVTLRGDWNDPDATDFNGDYGTVIHAVTSPKRIAG
jgi:hypothetical protein